MDLRDARNPRNPDNQPSTFLRDLLIITAAIVCPVVLIVFLAGVR